MRLIGALVSAFAFTWLTGCSNALYFYETEKISMSLEGRPDSSQPVQGSLGLKQRVAILAPPNDPDTMTKGEAMSMISSFRFRKDPGTLRDLGPVTIQTAFVTGKAARSLESPQAERIAQAIAQAQVQVIGPDTPDILARKKRLSNCVKDMSDNTKLEAIAKILIGAPSGTKTDIRTRIRNLKLPEELEEFEKSEKLCP